MLLISGPWGAFLAWIISAYGATPEDVRRWAYVTSLFMVLDGISGVVVSAKLGTLNAQGMRTSLLVKSTQYGLVMGLAAGIGVIIRSWYAVQLALGAIAMIEVVSILQRIHRLEALGGVSFGPAKPAVQWMSSFFGQSDQEVGTTDKKEVPK